MIVFVVLGIEPSVGSDVECLRLSQAGPGLGGGGSFGLDRGLLVLVGSLGLLEDVDDVLALVVGGRCGVSKACDVCMAILFQRCDSGGGHPSAEMPWRSFGAVRLCATCAVYCGTITAPPRNGSYHLRW